METQSLECSAHVAKAGPDWKMKRSALTALLLIHFVNLAKKDLTGSPYVLGARVSI